MPGKMEAAEGVNLAGLNTLPEKTESTQVLEALSRGHLEPLPIWITPSGTD